MTARSCGATRCWPSSFGLVTVAGVTLARLIGGTVVIEGLLEIPGLGNKIIRSLSVRDYTMIQGIAAFLAIVYVFLSVAVEVIYALLDPVRYGNGRWPSERHRNRIAEGRRPDRGRRAVRRVRKENRTGIGVRLAQGWMALTVLAALTAQWLPIEKFDAAFVLGRYQRPVFGASTSPSVVTNSAGPCCPASHWTAVASPWPSA